jgi:flagella basal body P-ring formation protein FlgA
MNFNLNPIHRTMMLAALAGAMMPSHRCHGADLGAEETVQIAPQEKFVPGTPRYLSGATLEMRGEATIIGGDVKLKQICRWSEADKVAFEPIEDLVIVRMGSTTAFRALTQKELKTLLHDAGVNLAVIRFAGTLQCTINRSDVATAGHSGMDEWIAARKGPAPSEDVELSKSSSPVASMPGPAQTARSVQPAKTQEANAPKTVRDLLTADLAERLSLEPASIQMKFSPKDEKVLNLSDSLFRFDIDDQRARNLGPVTWEVTVIAGGASQKATIEATARAWQDQLVVNKPLGYHQTIRGEDLTDRRALVEQLTGEATMKREQAVGQWAGQDLHVGTILTPRLIEAAPLVKTGQLVSITAEQGTVQIKTVARALESGSFGQTIRVKNETTGDVYEATLTGLQTAKVSASVSTEKPNVATVGN